MAIKSYRVDDLDDKITEGVQTVTFAYEGKAYEIDLGEKNRAEFADVMSKYLEVAEPVTSKAPSAARSTAPSGVTRAPMTMKYSPETSAEATEWAKSEEGAAYLKKAGIEYKGAGRTPYKVIEAYLEAQKA